MKFIKEIDVILSKVAEIFPMEYPREEIALVVNPAGPYHAEMSILDGNNNVVEYAGIELTIDNVSTIRSGLKELCEKLWDIEEMRAAEVEEDEEKWCCEKLKALSEFSPKIVKKFEHCPYCGILIDEDKKDDPYDDYDEDENIAESLEDDDDDFCEDDD